MLLLLFVSFANTLVVFYIVIVLSCLKLYQLLCYILYLNGSDYVLDSNMSYYHLLCVFYWLHRIEKKMIFLNSEPATSTVHPSIV